MGRDTAETGRNMHITSSAYFPADFFFFFLFVQNRLCQPDVCVGVHWPHKQLFARLYWEIAATELCSPPSHTYVCTPYGPGFPRIHGPGVFLFCRISWILKIWGLWSAQKSYFSLLTWNFGFQLVGGGSG